MLICLVRPCGLAFATGGFEFLGNVQHTDWAYSLNEIKGHGKVTPFILLFKFRLRGMGLGYGEWFLETYKARERAARGAVGGGGMLNLRSPREAGRVGLGGLGFRVEGLGLV